MAFQELADLKPERVIGSRGILRRAEVNQDQRLTFVNDVAFRVVFHPVRKIIQLFLERGLAVGILIEDVLVHAAQERNEFKASFELGPGGIEIAGVVANGLILQAEGGGTVWQVFLGEGLAVEDAAHIVGDFDQGRVHAQGFHPGDVALDDRGVRAIVTAADGLHIFGLQKRNGGAGLKRDGVGAEPSFVLHDDHVTIVGYDERASGIA